MANTYDKSKDPFRAHAARLGDPSKLIQLVTPNDGANLPTYAKSLRIYVPSATSEATLAVVPVAALDDTEIVVLKYSPGVFVEPLAVRKVLSTGTTGTITIHAFV